MNKRLVSSLTVCLMLITIVYVVFNVNAVSINDETDFIISGPTHGYVGVSYNFTFYLAPNQYGDNFYLQISWRIENNTGWMGPYPTGQNITLSNSWGRMGFYTIQAFAKCNISIYYETYEVGIFKSKVLEPSIWQKEKILNNPIFFTFLERFPLLNLLLKSIIIK